MCLTTFSTESAKRYTLLKLFFGYLRPLGTPKIHARFGAVDNNWIWTPLKNKDQENYATEKDQENYAPELFSQSGGRPPPSDPYILTPASHQYWR